MREIKFRAWDKIQNKLVSVLVIDWLNQSIDLPKGQIERDFDEVELMQCAGLKDDETGEDVYEGDIANLYWSDAIGEPHLEKVVIKSPFEYSAEEAMYFVHADRLEVIGNIYENPELLETKKD